MHIVSLAGCAVGAGVRDTVWLPWISGGLRVQKSTGDVSQVLVDWIWDLEDLGAAAGLNL